MSLLLLFGQSQAAPIPVVSSSGGGGSARGNYRNTHVRYVANPQPVYVWPKNLSPLVPEKPVTVRRPKAVVTPAPVAVPVVVAPQVVPSRKPYTTRKAVRLFQALDAVEGVLEVAAAAQDDRARTEQYWRARAEAERRAAAVAAAWRAEEEAREARELAMVQHALFVAEQQRLEAERQEAELMEVVTFFVATLD